MGEHSPQNQVALTGPAYVSARSSADMLQLLLDDLGGLLKKELGMCLMLLPALETLFLQGCVTQP